MSPASSPRGFGSLTGLLILVLLTLVAWLAVPVQAPHAQTVSSRPAYGLNASIDYANATLNVQQTTRFRNSTGLVLDQAVFHVGPAYERAFRLTSASSDGQQVTTGLNGTVLEVALPRPVQPGGTAEISLEFKLDVPRAPGRFSTGSAMTLGNWYPTLAVHRGDWDRRQYVEVGDAFLTDVSDYQVELSTSEPLVLAASGRVVEDKGTSFRVDALGVRDFALSLSPRYQVSELQVEGTLVRAYTFSAARSRLFAETAGKYLQWYGQRFGAYPYRVFSVADADLPISFAGMEYPGLVLIASSLDTPSPFAGSSTDLLIGHEVAHQWFYSLVGNDQRADPWIDEAFAEYLPYYYYRHNNAALFEVLWSGRLAGLTESARAAGSLPVDSSVYDFPSDPPYFTIVYRQGAQFLDQLRRAMGDADFEAAIRDEINVFGDRIASPRAVLDIFQRHTSQNLNPLIGRYFSYGAFDDPAPATWRVESPETSWRSSAYIFIGAEFPITAVEVWLDNRRLYAGEQNAVTLNLSGIDPGEYALLIRVWDHRGAQLERARKVTIE